MAAQGTGWMRQTTALLKSVGLAGAVLVAGLFATAASGSDKLRLGPKAGASVPVPIVARDQAGKRRDLASIVGKRGVILLFSRSLDWCVYCKAEARDWNGYVKAARAIGYSVAILTYDSVGKLARYAERSDSELILLSDPKSAVIKGFGLLNEAYAPGSYAHGVPHPIILAIDPKGVVTHRFSEATYSRRPAPNDVLKALRNRKNNRPGG